MVYCDDCLNVLKTMETGSVDMIYLDPPFYTQKEQCLKDSNGKEYEFSDIWSTRDEYLNYMRLRIVEARRVLKETGNIFLHCDTSASHYLRVMMDDIFGEDNFRSEIIWSYKRWSNSKKGLLCGHQTIFYYSKTKKYKFNIMYKEYSPTTNLDQILQERERSIDGKAHYKRDENGDVKFGKEKKGVPMSDVWEIPFLNPKAKERTGYPTQKPIELLERIIKISTDEGETVLDPFCGSGTTLVAAKLLNRNYIGIDINPKAIDLCEVRLQKPFKTNSELLKVGLNSYRKKTDKELAILQLLDCDIVQRNKGIDGFLKKHYLNAPVAVKIQKENEDFGESVNLLENAASKKKCSFAVLIKTKEDLEDKNIKIPSNMIIINDCKSQLEIELQRKIMNKSTDDYDN